MAAVVKPSLPQLRSMSSEDLVRVAAIEHSAYEFAWTPGIFRDCLRAGHACWVLACDEEIMGYGVLSAGAGEAHVLNVCVAPEYQGRGHGRRILQRLMDTARWYGAERVFLEVRPSNAIAQTLYESAGFNVVGHRPRYYPARNGREDAIIMAMDLLPPEDS